MIWLLNSKLWIIGIVLGIIYDIYVWILIQFGHSVWDYAFSAVKMLVNQHQTSYFVSVDSYAELIFMALLKEICYNVWVEFSKKFTVWWVQKLVSGKVISYLCCVNWYFFVWQLRTAWKMVVGCILILSYVSWWNRQGNKTGNIYSF